MTSIAVAGWAMTTPLGEDELTLDALFEQRSAFTCQASPWPLRNTLAAVISNRPEATQSDRAWQRHLALSVARRALHRTAFDLRRVRHRCALIFATSYGHLLDDPGGDTMSRWARDCARSLELDVEPIVVGSGCSSGSDALGVGAAMLDADAIDVALVVAVDIVSSAKRIAHSHVGTMTAGLHKPFDIARSGMLLGEAASAVVLTRSADAGVHHGELIGVGAANDAFGLTAPDPSGVSVRYALDRALRAAGLGYGDLSIYFAHGTATQLNDALEAKIIEEVFADQDDVAVVGTKGALGHSLGACGVVEFVLLLQMLNRRRAPPTVGLTQPIEGVAARFAGPPGRALRSAYGVSVTLGFGGFNTALIARGLT